MKFEEIKIIKDKDKDKDKVFKEILTYILWGIDYIAQGEVECGIKIIRDIRK